MNVEPPETLVIIESIVYKSNGFAIILQIKQWELYIRVTSGFSALNWQTWQDLLLG